MRCSCGASCHKRPGGWWCPYCCKLYEFEEVESTPEEECMSCSVLEDGGIEAVRDCDHHYCYLERKKFDEDNSSTEVDEGLSEQSERFDDDWFNETWKV